MDVVFIIDSSGSIRHERFQIVKDFVKGIVDELEIGSDKTRVGVISWSNQAKVEVNSIPYQLFSIQHISSLQHMHSLDPSLPRIYYLQHICALDIFIFLYAFSFVSSFVITPILITTFFTTYFFFAYLSFIFSFFTLFIAKYAYLFLQFLSSNACKWNRCVFKRLYISFVADNILLVKTLFPTRNIVCSILHTLDIVITVLFVR